MTNEQSIKPTAENNANPISEPNSTSTSPNKSPFPLVFGIITLLALSATGYLYYQNQQLTSQLISTQSTINTQPTASPTPTSTGWIEYTNENLSFSFSYPKDFLVADNLQTSTDPSAWSTKNNLMLTNQQNGCTFSLMINPDGFGPNFPNKTEQVSYHDGKGFTIDQTIENTENLTPNLYTVIYSSAAAPKINENIYGIWAQANCPATSAAQSYIDETYSKILSTFKFTNQKQTSQKILGYIKTIDQDAVFVDEITWIDDPAQPNGYRLSNPSTSETELALAKNTSFSIVRSLYPDLQIPDDEQSNLDKFITYLNQNQNLKNALFEFLIEDDQIITITEKYIP